MTAICNEGNHVKREFRYISLLSNSYMKNYLVTL